jgi:hypothetical protein
MNRTQLIEMASAILELADECEYYRRRCHQQELDLEEYRQHVEDSIKDHEQSFVGMLSAALDPDSGINRMARAVVRDPLKGAVGPCQ